MGRPMAVLFATNLARSLDAAIMRRATATYHFDRPSLQQRTELFKRMLAHTGISELQIDELARSTAPRVLPGFGNTEHRYTYSDLSQRILSRAVEEAVYNQHALSIQDLLNACNVTLPTPEMQKKGMTRTEKKLPRRVYVRR